MAKIADKIASQPPDTDYFSLEFFPPKTNDGFHNLLPRLHRLRALQPLFVCVTFSAGGTTASKSLELADYCQNQLGLTTCLHLTCTNIPKSIIDSVLRECKRFGICNILALRGDEPRPGEYASSDSINRIANVKGYGQIAETQEDNGPLEDEEDDGEDADLQFRYAVDLIRYIRRKHGAYFCIGAAAYPEGHPVPSAAHAGGYSQSAEHDLQFLAEKIEAGADFVLTQLFYDVEKYLEFEKLAAAYRDGALAGVPIVPGLMPIQGWQSFSRTCKLARVGLPSDIKARLEVAKGDDEGVKEIGVEIVGQIVDEIQSDAWRTRPLGAGQQARGRRAHGFHFYTLNLEKAVAQILERCDLVPPQGSLTLAPDVADRLRDTSIHSDQNAGKETSLSPPRDKPMRPKPPHRRRSSAAHNRVVVSNDATSPGNADFEALQAEAARPRLDPESQPREDTLAIAEGEGSLGREATWDDFPNGRWGDSRSPAYAATNNYALHPLLAPSSALALWSHPTSVSDVTSIFRQFLLGTLPAIPWSEDTDASELEPETDLIKDELLRLNEKNWWTVASQPAVNAAKSSDRVVGWGPQKGGLVWQKPFVEFFLPSKDWVKLKAKLDAREEEVVYFAGNANGDFEATKDGGVNPVTWGTFKGKDIITPTIIETVSFRDWQEEAFGIWQEWQSVFVPPSASAKLLGELRADVWLVNVIGHDYTPDGKLWEILLDD